MSEKDTCLEKTLMIAGAALAVFGGISIVTDEMAKARFQRQVKESRKADAAINPGVGA